jgi:hypothetical protein
VYIRLKPRPGTPPLAVQTPMLKGETIPRDFKIKKKCLNINQILKYYEETLKIKKP